MSIFIVASCTALHRCMTTRTGVASVKASARNAASNGMITHQFNNMLRKYVPTSVQLSAEKNASCGLR